jgi:hypothetical protein
MQKEPKVEYPAPKDARSPMKTWRILFLDSAGNVKKLKDACKHAGYEVVGALTIEEAWAFLDGKDHADVIICAPHLEEGSMFEFLQGVRDSKVQRNAKFLILSLAPGTLGATPQRARDWPSARMPTSTCRCSTPMNWSHGSKSCNRSSRCSKDRTPPRRSVDRSNAAGTA